MHRPGTATANTLSAPLATLAISARYHKDQEICGQGELATSWFQVEAGAARCCRVGVDGRRRVVGLLLVGDFFGFTVARNYPCSVDSVMNGTVVLSLSRSRAEALADRDSAIAREIRELAFAAIEQLQNQLMTTGRTTAREKVASFLIEMSGRSLGGNERIELPISRYDIADYLAISAETVSRALSSLQNSGLIDLAGARLIRIADADALRNRARPHRTQPH